MLRTEELVVKVDDEGGKKCLLDHISFEVKDGEMLVITGPNGGGKSTLAKTLIGINKPESGKIYLDDVDITDYDINHRANAGIGFAFQQPPRFKGNDSHQTFVSCCRKGVIQAGMLLHVKCGRFMCK